MNRRRLNMLKKDLQLLIKKDKKIKEKKIKFNMNWWAEKLPKKKGRECGTVCCAAGLHCMLHPKADLYLEDLNGFNKLDLLLKSDPYCDSSNHALRQYFDLSVEDVEFLFFPSFYDFKGRNKGGDITPQMVIERIDEVLNGANGLHR